MDFLKALEEVLRKDDRFVAEDGKLLKPIIYSCCMNMDKNLISLLLNNEDTKAHFFTDVEGVLVFDKVKFGWVVDSKEFLPDSYTLYKNKIGLTDNNGNLISAKEDVSLVWPYKDCVLEGGQTKDDQKRDEIFYNEVLAPDEVKRLLHPKVFTNAKRYTKDGVEDTTSFDENDSLIIKGNNLLALSSLLKRYEGKVKCIYIDPPYNTGSDSFNYNDNFNHSSWLTFMKNRLELARRLLKDDGAIFIQCDDNEQAYLRVFCDEIFKNEYLNTVILKSKSSSGASGGGEDKRLKKNVEYLLIYTKSNFSMKDQHKVFPLSLYIQERKETNKTFAYTNVLIDSGELEKIGETFDGKGETIELFRVKNYKTKTINQICNEEKLTKEQAYLLYFEKIYTTENAQTSIRRRVEEKTEGEDYVIARYTPVSGKNKGKKTDVGFIGNTKRLVSFLSNTAFIENNSIKKIEKVGTLWDDISWSSIDKEGEISFSNGKKPEKLLHRIIDMSTEENDLILDFHLGSGTTAAVAHKMGRRYIGVEQMDYINTITVPRLQKVIESEQGGISKDVEWQGGGSFVYCELKELNESFVSEIQSANNKEELIKLKTEILATGFVSHKVDIKEISEKDTEYENLSLEEQKRFLIELIDKNKLYVNYSEIDDEDMKVSDDEKAFTHSFYKKEV